MDDSHLLSNSLVSSWLLHTLMQPSFFLKCGGMSVRGPEGGINQRDEITIHGMKSSKDGSGHIYFIVKDLLYSH